MSSFAQTSADYLNLLFPSSDVMGTAVLHWHTLVTSGNRTKKERTQAEIKVYSIYRTSSFFTFTQNPPAKLKWVFPSSVYFYDIILTPEVNAQTQWTLITCYIVIRLLVDYNIRLGVICAKKSVTGYPVSLILPSVQKHHQLMLFSIEYFPSRRTRQIKYSY